MVTKIKSFLVSIILSCFVLTLPPFIFSANVRNSFIVLINVFIDMYKGLDHANLM
jgi:hypothetical protein